MIKDYNRGEVNKKEVFHFKNSLCPFIEVTNCCEDSLFLDLNNFTVYTYDELEYEELYFYEKEDDEDFMGVDVECTIEEWFK